MSKTPLKLTEDESLQGNDIFVGISKVERNYPLHFHEFYEIEIAIEGEGIEIINGNSYEITPSKLFLFTPQDYHEIIAKKPLDIYDIAFNTTCIDDEAIANFLEYDSNIIEIEGHTDNIPEKSKKFANNDELSSARALSVFYFLADNTNLDPAMIKHTGRGEYMPIADNSTSEGRDRNRRVEIKIYHELSNY